MDTPKAHLHCKACHAEGQPSGYMTAGLIDPITLQLSCAVCEQPVGTFQLVKPEDTRCGICGQAGEHVH